MLSKIVILDYGMGNILSVKKKLERLNIAPEVASNYKQIETADKIIMPGVGHFKKAMENLISNNMIDTLQEQVLVKQKPILGICLGMQLMAMHSEEGDANGLSWIDAKVIRFRNNPNDIKHKIPQMGWNDIEIKKQSPLMREITDGTEFYFIHSYHLVSNDKNIILNTTNYIYSFVSAIEKDNIFGVQYHPEKSHTQGEQLIKNFLKI